MEKRNLEDLIRVIYDRKYQSVWTATLGQNQSGKTDWNLKQLEMIHDLGLGDAFGANMPIDASFDIEFIEDFETLKARCLALNPDPERYGIKRYFFLGSEMGDWAPQDQPWLNVKLIKELQKVRKYGLNFLGDGIARIDQRVLNENHFHGYFEKASKSRPDRAVYYDWFNRRLIRIYDIPRTSLDFNTWYSASFYMEPQTPTDLAIPWKHEHEIVFKYLDTGSWKESGVHRQEGKRALFKILRYYRDHVLRQMAQVTE